jgi:MscS family membrane protein
MRTTRWRRLTTMAVLSLGWLGGAACLPGQSPAAAQPAPRPANDSSPRDALRTLYYCVVAYDIQPHLMDEAVACLDLGPERSADPAEGVRLAIELEQVLRVLCVPIHSLPDRPDRDAVTVLDGDGFKIALARGPDGAWRFDRDTVNRIPAMSRLALARYRDLQGERAALRDGYSDPSAAMRRFLMDTMARDFYAAARSLDLSALDAQERGDRGPLLAWQLAFVMQRRGWVYLQEVPNQPSGPPFTWHADRTGRIVLERVRGDDGKEAWLFNKKTVRNIPAMFEAARSLPPGARFVCLGVDLPTPTAAGPGLGARRPPDVPPQLGSPRAMLQAFFRVMDAAEAHDRRLADALQFLDLDGVPQADRRAQGAKVAAKLEAVLRKASVDLSALPDAWSAPMQVLGEAQGVRVEIVRGRDGCWRFSRATVAQAPAFFDKLAARDRGEGDRAAHLDSARDAISTFLSSTRKGDFEEAAECLDLSAYRPGTRDEAGPALAFKLRYVMDRLGRVYIQEVPDQADGPRYVFYRGDLGRIVIARQTDGPRKGSWLFTSETVTLIEPMFRAVIDKPPDESAADGALPPPRFWHAPGLWLRFQMPAAARMVVWRMQAYQWLGLALAVLASALASWLLLAQVQRLVALVLRKCGSALTRQFVAARLRPLTWVAAWWLLFEALALLDLPIRFIDAVLPLKTFGMAVLIGWFGIRLVDLATGVYMNSELLRPHRSLSDMVVPVSMRALKGALLLVVAVYVVYQIGEGEHLSRFLTGLGVAGLAASLAAQDALKSFFSTLLLIGERSFKIGDRIVVGSLEGVVEQVGFRATRLRTSDGSLLTVPNSTIASAAIDNLSTKAFSRCKATLLVKYDVSPERLLKLRDRIRAWLVARPGVVADRVVVSINRLTDQGVEVALDLYLTEVSPAAEKALKEEINFEVLRMCEELAGESDDAYHPLTGEKGRGARPAARAA